MQIVTNVVMPALAYIGSVSLMLMLLSTNRSTGSRTERTIDDDLQYKWAQQQMRHRC